MLWTNVPSPGLPEAIWFKLRSHGDVVQHGIMSFFGFGEGDIGDRIQPPPVVESVDPFERGIFDSFAPQNRHCNQRGLGSRADAKDPGPGIQALSHMSMLILTRS